MAPLGDTLTQATDQASGITDGAGSLTQNDAGKNDVQGGRKGTATTTTDDDDTKPKEKDSSLKIKIHLDIDVEVHLTARVKGDIVIGLL